MDRRIAKDRPDSCHRCRKRFARVRRVRQGRCGDNRKSPRGGRDCFDCRGRPCILSPECCRSSPTGSEGATPMPTPPPRRHGPVVQRETGDLPANPRTAARGRRSRAPPEERSDSHALSPYVYPVNPVGLGAHVHWLFPPVLLLSAAVPAAVLLAARLSGWLLRNRRLPRPQLRLLWSRSRAPSDAGPASGSPARPPAARPGGRTPLVPAPRRARPIAIRRGPHVFARPPALFPP